MMRFTARCTALVTLALTATLLVGCPPDGDGDSSDDTGVDTGAASCPGANPAGCNTDEDCPVGRVCRQDPDTCTPSGCNCENGSWACTDDCSGTVCAAPRDAGEPGDTQWGECSDPDPSGCDSDEDCSNGRVCRSSADRCIPTDCECRGSGNWSCTTDCNGTACLPPVPDVSDTSDGSETTDTSDASDAGDTASSDTSDATDAVDASDTGGDAITCSEPDPSGCDDDADCAADEVCRDDPDTCTPSSCSCTENGWLCTRDCGGTVCMPARDAGSTDASSDTSDAGSDTADAGCTDPDPSGCDDDGDCASDEVCKDDPNTCTPSSCSCSNGTWLCTTDCNGTVCMTE